MLSRSLHRSVGPAPDFPGEVHASRRARLLERIGGGVAIIPAGPELLKSRDTEVRFRQSSDLHYLTGFPEPDAVAVLTPHDAASTFTLFLRPRDAAREAWSGHRIGLERAGELFGADAVHPIEELSARLPELLRPAEAIHYPVGANARIDAIVAAALVDARRQRQRSGVGPTALVDLEAATGSMRVAKEPAEIERMRRAAEIGAEGHLAAMRRARPGAGEWEIQAALEGTFLAHGAAIPAFPSIVAGGANATVLHYVENRSRVRDGDLILIDAGAEWGMYNSDITRTFPASGRFSADQRALYDVVLAAERAAIEAVRPGAPFSSVHDAAVRVLTDGMIDLGLLPPSQIETAIESDAYKRFYLHQTSHWLGLDVHDVGLYREGGDWVSLQPGMVLTIEPGLYIPADAGDAPARFRGVGIRIEDDVVVTESGHEILTRHVPVDPEEIERVMAGD